MGVYTHLCELAHRITIDWPGPSWAWVACDVRPNQRRTGAAMPKGQRPRHQG